MGAFFPQWSIVIAFAAFTAITSSSIGASQVFKGAWGSLGILLGFVSQLSALFVTGFVIYWAIGESWREALGLAGIAVAAMTLAPAARNRFGTASLGYWVGLLGVVLLPPLGIYLIAAAVG